MKICCACLAFLFLPLPALTDDAAADRILGVWATEKAEAHVEISRDENGYNGSIIWLKEPFFSEADGGDLAGKPKTDRENPDPALHDRAIIGLPIMNEFRYSGKNRWVDGTIYDPENGKTYECYMWLTKDGSLKVRGYVGISLFGRTSEWTPVLARASEKTE